MTFRGCKVSEQAQENLKINEKREVFEFLGSFGVTGGRINDHIFAPN
jgi:hypothetical protein